MWISCYLPLAPSLAFTCSCFEHGFKEPFSVDFSILSILSSVWTWVVQAFPDLSHFSKFVLVHVLILQSSLHLLLMSESTKSSLFLQWLPPFFFFIQKYCGFSARISLFLYFPFSLFVPSFLFKYVNIEKYLWFSLKYIFLQSLLLFGYALLSFLLQLPKNTIMVTSFQWFSQLLPQKTVFWIMFRVYFHLNASSICGFRKENDRNTHQTWERIKVLINDYILAHGNLGI
jgi:hypothetical protein